ncbi:zinc-finger-Ran binding domain-containing protein, related [Neospora caninum Liverpool]|uniref:Zinc-finger-Ran binding domain-containing protein, related n=1 Tax=Neospora caninum (strain Liverpool) TaxID=572307 RepID=F0VC21_NEOCL|nr:zinc-finger-Ran binding domain-containing protein, related [Neospora caninum Liverpool]CBZ51155.1 zinc-finger-Ran binding domain-containing protein, related [Neospora caninum Liverpool]CEL68466.1 TPA: Zinc-finger-Ran binding domain-containing protein, related [Neospora caninum Liverpool]|eukprot:XP_003881188.1 zinc-finger-Ran binding domain-containing protein, related [Neospora caninum Liverpool]
MESIVSEVAQKTVLILVDEFISQGDESPLDRTVEILQVALLSCEAKKTAAQRLGNCPSAAGASGGTGSVPDGLLVDGITRTRETRASCASRSSSAGQAEGSTRRNQGQVLGGGVHFAAPRVLVPPENLKNPSSFLKIYGDPLCFAGSRNLVAGCRGNWKCTSCGTVNFPRRFRCKQCDKERDEEGHRIVLEYAKTVYQQYLAAGVWPVSRGDSSEAPPPVTLYASPRACRRLKNMGAGESHKWRWKRRGGGKDQNGGNDAAASGTVGRNSRSETSHAHYREGATEAAGDASSRPASQGEVSLMVGASPNVKFNLMKQVGVPALHGNPLLEISIESFQVWYAADREAP